MRATPQGHCRLAIGEGQRQQDRLQDQCRRTGAAALAGFGSVEGVAARESLRLGYEGQRERAEFRADDLSRAECGSRADSREMLCSQPWLGRPARIFTRVTERPVITDKLSAVRRISPPPSPWAPSMTNGRSPNAGARMVIIAVPLSAAAPDSHRLANIYRREFSPRSRLRQGYARTKSPALILFAEEPPNSPIVYKQISIRFTTLSTPNTYHASYSAISRSDSVGTNPSRVTTLPFVLTRI